VNVDQDLVVSRDRLGRFADAQRANSFESVAKNCAHVPPGRYFQKPISISSLRQPKRTFLAPRILEQKK
jgi:hypothetical protein